MNRQDEIAFQWNELMILCEAREMYAPEEYERRYDEIVAQINELEVA